MPTPAEDTVVPCDNPGIVHTTCPPEDNCNPDVNSDAQSSSDTHPPALPSLTQPIPILSEPPHGARVADPRHAHLSLSPTLDERNSPSPVDLGLLKAANQTLPPQPPSPGVEYAAAGPWGPSSRTSEVLRTLPKHTSSYLRSGSVFQGTQQSDRQIYNVKVEVKEVDMAESFICGYLTIQGLTQDHPTLTTYFEGEIIGTKYAFQTRRADWGANEKVDMQHWNRFPAWKPLSRAARKPDFNYKDFANRENVFMRWKEYFLVPDHRVRTISGASFEGFYYICFNQKQGTISGIYFHSKSEKFQQLELQHVEDYGCAGGFEFR